MAYPRDYHVKLSGSSEQGKPEWRQICWPGMPAVKRLGWSPSTNFMERDELIGWLQTLSPDSTIVVDEGGLTLVEIGRNGKPTGAYLEIGGSAAC